MLRGKQTLDIFHHENSGFVDSNDSQIFPVEEVFLVLVELFVIGSSGSSSERVGLAGRPAD